MLLKFPATLDVKDYNYHNITKSDNLVCLRYEPIYSDKIRAELRKINAKNGDNEAKGKEPVQLDVTVDVHYTKRSLDANAWLWAAHTLEANIVNGHKSAWTDSENIKWREVGSVTPEMIHEDYMERYAPRGFVDVEPGFVDAVRRMINETMGRVVKEEWQADIQKMRFEIWKTSSYMNVREFCELSERVKENILAYGVDLNDAVDYRNLISDLQGVIDRAQENEKKATPEVKPEVTPEVTKCKQLQTSADESEQATVLTQSKDTVSMVKDVFRGEELDIF